MLSSSLSRAALLAALLATCLPACKDKPDAPRLIAEAQALSLIHISEPTRPY